MARLDSLESLFEGELKDIYDAEKRLTKALPKMIKAVQSEELRGALSDHLTETNGQVARLEQVFEAAGLKAVAKTCAGMKGLIEEGQEAIDSEGSEPFTDLAIIGAARRVEHYEMAAYMSLMSLAEQLHDSNVTDLIRQNLEEEEKADETLASVSEVLMSSSPAKGEETAAPAQTNKPRAARSGA